MNLPNHFQLSNMSAWHLHKFRNSFPLLASALVMVAAAFSIDCGLAGYGGYVEDPRSFQSTWIGYPFLLEEDSRQICVSFDYCVGSSCAKACTFHEKDDQGAGSIETGTYSNCEFQQVLSDQGDSLLLTCLDCGPDGSPLELFRVNSGGELYGTEVEVVDRDNPTKRIRVLDRRPYCEAFFMAEDPDLSPP